MISSTTRSFTVEEDLSGPLPTPSYTGHKLKRALSRHSLSSPKISKNFNHHNNFSSQFSSHVHHNNHNNNGEIREISLIRENKKKMFGDLGRDGNDVRDIIGESGDCLQSLDNLLEDETLPRSNIPNDGGAYGVKAGKNGPAPGIGQMMNADKMVLRENFNQINVQVPSNNLMGLNENFTLSMNNLPSLNSVLLNNALMSSFISQDPEGVGSASYSKLNTSYNEKHNLEAEDPTLSTMNKNLLTNLQNLSSLVAPNSFLNANKNNFDNMNLMQHNYDLPVPSSILPQKTRDGNVNYPKENANNNSHILNSMSSQNWYQYNPSANFNTIDSGHSDKENVKTTQKNNIALPLVKPLKPINRRRSSQSQSKATESVAENESKPSNRMANEQDGETESNDDNKDSSGQWTKLEEGVLLHLVEGLVHCELKFIAKAARLCGIYRQPRAVDKKLKRLIGFKNWKQRENREILVRLKEVIAAESKYQLSEDMLHTVKLVIAQYCSVNE